VIKKEYFHHSVDSMASPHEGGICSIQEMHLLNKDLSSFRRESGVDSGRIFLYDNK
jgi:hypothetical protein